MQLHYYWSILRRFWLLLVVLPLVVGLGSLALELREPQRYSASARMMVTQTPLSNSQEAPFPDFNLNHSWLSSSFILDDLPQVVSSRAFAEDVSDYLTDRGANVPPERVQGSLSAEKFHRAVTIVSVADTPQMAEALIQGAVVALQQNGLQYWNRTNEMGNGLSIGMLDPINPAGPIGSTRRMVMNVALRAGLALAAAVGLAFLLYYIDDRLRDRQQVEAWVGVPVIGTIPKE